MKQKHFAEKARHLQERGPFLSLHSSCHKTNDPHRISPALTVLDNNFMKPAAMIALKTKS